MGYRDVHDADMSVRAFALKVDAEQLPNLHGGRRTSVRGQGRPETHPAATLFVTQHSATTDSLPELLGFSGWGEHNPWKWTAFGLVCLGFGLDLLGS